MMIALPRGVNTPVAAIFGVALCVVALIDIAHPSAVCLICREVYLNLSTVYHTMCNLSIDGLYIHWLPGCRDSLCRYPCVTRTLCSGG
jgi:hypothetical protein